MSQLLRTSNFLRISQRFKSNRRYNWNNEGIQYFGFKYYPRHPEEFKDPPYTPSKLFRVQRVKELKGVPFYEKRLLAEFKLDGKLNDIAIVKNIPENNQRLWRIKHLIKIDPITFPDGFPMDTIGTYLRENGELRVRKVLEPYEEKLRLTENFINNPEKLDGETLRKDSRLKWLSGWQ